MHHRPDCRLAHFQVTSRLTGRQTLFGVEHQGDKQKPALQIDVGIVKNGADCDRKGLVTGPALPPVPRSFAVRHDLVRTAIGAGRAFAPPQCFKMFDARRMVRPAAVNFDDAGHWLFDQRGLKRLVCGDSSGVILKIAAGHNFFQRGKSDLPIAVICRYLPLFAAICRYLNCDDYPGSSYCLPEGVAAHPAIVRGMFVV